MRIDLSSFVLGVLTGAAISASLACIFLDNVIEPSLMAENQLSDRSGANTEEASDGGVDEVSSSFEAAGLQEAGSVAQNVEDDAEFLTAGDHLQAGDLTQRERTEMARRAIQQRHNELRLESKELSWAYFTEQAIQQFLASHEDFYHFQLGSIECRSNTCLIEVSGANESVLPTWYQIMYDLRQEPWYEFVQSGHSGYDVDGVLVILERLHTPRDLGQP